MNIPNLLTTVEWGAKRVNPKQFQRPYRGTGIVIHHTAGYCNDNNPEHYARNIQRQHMKVNGWSDSGHHFLVCRDGTICEGRTGSVEAVKAGRFIRGAHTGDDWSNSHLWGIENEGNTNEKPLTSLQVDSLVNLMAWICFYQKIDSGGKLEPGVYNVTGHRDWKATQCPGSWLYDQIPSLRLKIHNQLIKPH